MPPEMNPFQKQVRGNQEVLLPGGGDDGAILSDATAQRGGFLQAGGVLPRPPPQKLYELPFRNAQEDYRDGCRSGRVLKMVSRFFLSAFFYRASSAKIYRRNSMPA